MHPALKQVEHRPWPLPAGRWTWRQSWRDLLFAHWPVPASRLQALVPPALRVQEFGGTSWVGLVPFRMAGVMLRPLPDLPWISAFPEVNLRLYVEHEGRPGVWFVSLDATQPLAVRAARRFFHLPYFRADISLEPDAAEGVRYRSKRRDGPCDARLEVDYRPTGEVEPARPSSLDHFLTERYCLYAQAPDRSLWRAEVHHAPWPLQPASAEFRVETFGSSQGIPLEGPPTRLHFSRRIDVVVWSPVRVA